MVLGEELVLVERRVGLAEAVAHPVDELLATLRRLGAADVDGQVHVPARRERRALRDASRVEHLDQREVRMRVDVLLEPLAYPLRLLAVVPHPPGSQVDLVRGERRQDPMVDVARLRHARSGAKASGIEPSVAT